jgi:asparagine synthase (glutamine-hydrolysing)
MGTEFAGFLLGKFEGVDESGLVDQILGTLRDLNGFFAIVYCTNETCIAIVDRVRSIPLFYTKQVNLFHISDDPRSLMEENSSFEFNSGAALEFLLSGYVTGGETINADVFQLDPGSMIVARGKASSITIEKVSYFDYFDPECLALDDGSLEESLYQRIEEVFDRYSSLFRSNKLLVPLSGGIDSRLIVAMLKKAGMDDVVCFTYGNSHSDDVNLSRRVAEALGYKWRFVPYNGWQFWYRLSQDKTLHEYISLASAFCSIAHLQDWAAARQLASEFGDDEPIFVPGHTGDFLSGGHLPSELIFNPIDGNYSNIVAESIFSHHYYLWQLTPSCNDVRQSMIERIRRRFIQQPITRTMAAKCYEEWEWAGRQARFIINSVRVYDFFKMRWAMPLWDDMLMDFFMKLDVEAKYGKRIYINTLCKKVFIGKLSCLSEIPVSSTTQLVYRKRNTSSFQKGSLKRGVQIVLKMPIVNWIPTMIKNYRSDVFNMYGYFLSQNRGWSLLKPISSVMFMSKAKMDHEIEKVLSPHLRKPILMQSVDGLFTAQYLLKIWDESAAFL